MIAAPPEIADNGYWYSVETHIEGGNRTPVSVPGGSWCAWYANIEGTIYAVIRTSQPVSIITADVSIDTILEAAGFTSKPFGRISGE